MESSKCRQGLWSVVCVGLPQTVAPVAYCAIPCWTGWTTVKLDILQAQKASASPAPGWLCPTSRLLLPAGEN